MNISKKKPGQWPPNSPDLNPLDYAIWGILEVAIYGKKFNTIDELKAVDNWPKRLHACVEANGGYFEI